MKTLFFLVFYLSLLLPQQSKDRSVIIDTYTVGVINENNKYEFVMSKHNTFMYLDTSRAIITSNLINSDSKDPWAFDIIHQFNLESNNTTVFKVVPILNRKDTMTFMVIDLYKNPVTFTLMIKSKLYLFTK